MNTWEIVGVALGGYFLFLLLFIRVWSKLPRNWDELYPIVKEGAACPDKLPPMTPSRYRKESP
jgi:hypothetical protein